MSETIIYKDHPSWLSFLGLLLLAGSALLASLGGGEASGGIVVAAIFLLLAAVFRYRRLYTITNIRIISREGLIANNTNEIELRHIRGMKVRQNVWERVLGVGTIEIISTADGGAEVVFQGISDPVGVKDRIRFTKGAP